jgi:hypothetical protein
VFLFETLLAVFELREYVGPCIFGWFIFSLLSSDAFGVLFCPSGGYLLLLLHQRLVASGIHLESLDGNRVRVRLQ